MVRTKFRYCSIVSELVVICQLTLKMPEEIDFENWTISNFKGLVTLTLTLDRVIWHTVVHHSSTSTYIPNFIGIGNTFCGRTDIRTDGHLTHVIRSTLQSRPNKCNLIFELVLEDRKLHKITGNTNIKVYVAVTENKHFTPIECNYSSSFCLTIYHKICGLQKGLPRSLQRLLEWNWKSIWQPTKSAEVWKAVHKIWKQINIKLNN